MLRLPNLLLWLIPLLCVAGFFLWAICHRGPSNAELIQQFQNPPITSLKIDNTQADVGMFGITTHSPSGNEQFWIEINPQWVWPWQSYDWER